MGEAVSVDELAVKMEDENVRLLDVREADEFAIMHIRKAHNFPLSGFPESMTRLDKHKEYYVIDASGDRSYKECGYLVDAGCYAVKVECEMEDGQRKNQ